MNICPVCTAPQDEAGDRWSTCDRCGSLLAYCTNCEARFVRVWERDLGELTTSLRCPSCKQNTNFCTYIRKSTLYELSPYAFKFVNTNWVWHPTEYFDPEFPFVCVAEQIFGSQLQNDFQYADSALGKADLETGYAFVIHAHFVLDNQRQDFVVITHETGLEIFLIGVGLFVGAEISKYLLKRFLEESENRINLWWKSKMAAHRAKGLEGSADQPLVKHLVIRTPYWEITLDGDFSSIEREEIVALMARTSTPSETVDEFTSTLENEGLRTRILSHSRRIVRREVRE